MSFHKKIEENYNCDFKIILNRFSHAKSNIVYQVYFMRHLKIKNNFLVKTLQLHYNKRDN